MILLAYGKLINVRRLMSTGTKTPQARRTCSEGCSTSSSKFLPLRQLLQREHGSMCEEAAAMNATVQEVERDSPLVVMLRDASTAEQPVGMILHTSLLRLCRGPHAIVGSELPFAATLCSWPIPVVLTKASTTYRRIQAAHRQLRSHAHPQSCRAAAAAAALSRGGRML